MKLSILLFDGFTAMDVVGGYEVLAQVPGVEVEFVAARKGPVASDTRRLGLVAYRSFDEVRTTSILYVPGGPGVAKALENPTLIEYIRQLDSTSTWTMGICNGVALLGAAGLLSGVEVTTNWSWRERVAQYGARVRQSRYHRDGKMVTAAGVSASIDAGFFLAKLLAGDRVARLIQLGLEYFPEPPFEPGGVESVPQDLKNAVMHFERTTAHRRLTEVSAPF